MPVILLQSQPPTNLWFLFVAFAVTWLIFFVYAFFISRRRQDLEREIGDLQRELRGGDRDEEGGTGGQAEG
ncbi:MAG: CcmD family protein [Chloroflexota bacterium]|nr:CcmD family protein [Chloroflexota bacterium]